MATEIVNTHEAKSRLSELLRRVENGGDVILARNGTPVAKIVPWPPRRPERVPGAWAGQVMYNEPILGPDPDIQQLFDESTNQ